MNVMYSGDCLYQHNFGIYEINLQNQVKQDSALCFILMGK